MKRTGIVKAISRKKEGRLAFTLTDAKNVDGTDIWFNGDTLALEKGNTIEFEVDVNGIWHNFSKVRILASEVVSAGTVPVATPTPVAPSADQPLPEQTIVFAEVGGKKIKITLEVSN